MLAFYIDIILLIFLLFPKKNWIWPKILEHIQQSIKEKKSITSQF